MKNKSFNAIVKPLVKIVEELEEYSERKAEEIETSVETIKLLQEQIDEDTSAREKAISTSNKLKDLGL